MSGWIKKNLFLITHEHSKSNEQPEIEIPIMQHRGQQWNRENAGSDTVDQMFSIGNLDIRPFAISHDANEPSGFRIEHDGKSLAVATDLGIYDAYTVENLKGLDAILLEANHDVHMLEVGAYPYYLKQRVLGNRGHLSNELSGRLLCDILHDNMKYIMLGHLSKENNYEELAYETVKLEVTMGDNPYRGEDIPLMVANRDTISNILQI
ncbi:MAG: MBL fold metallo-hydrolase [Coprococcus phoceensis]